MKTTQQLNAAALFLLGLAGAVTLSAIAAKPAASVIALQPAVMHVTEPSAPTATENIPTVTIVGKRMRKA
jgi:hypothetical protein